MTDTILKCRDGIIEFTPDLSCTGGNWVISQSVDFDITQLDPVVLVSYLSAGFGVMITPLAFIWAGRVLMKYLYPHGFFN